MRGRAAAAEAGEAARREARPDRERWRRGAAAIAGALLIGMAIVLAAVIIPAVATDTHPALNRGPSIAAFSVHIVAALAAGGLLVGSATILRRRVWAIIAMVMAVVLALALFDAAAEFRQHGRDLKVATRAMWVGAAIEVGAAVLAAFAAFAGPGQRSRS
ncbi:MAG: hypothetical protein IT304_11620 [Dehalococcoidia bacterium]|nr:hypothetical protein [Dehalococcoidia bacterium]